MKKIYLYSALLIIIALVSLNFNFLGSKKFLTNILGQEIKNSIKRLVLGEQGFNDTTYFKGLAYNQKRFPETQFEKLYLEITDINLSSKNNSPSYYNKYMGIKTKYSRFYIEPIKNKILITYASGDFSYLKIDKEELIQSNYLSKLFGKRILNILVHKNNLFISYVWNSENKPYDKSNIKQCNYLKVAKASLSEIFLDFEEVFKTVDCKNRISAGKMSFYESAYPGILLTTDAQFEHRNLAQIKKSSFGKIILINTDNYEYKIFSNGHRNPMGLFVGKDIILETEHGPCGGDEINLIEENQNYGWPNVSVGDNYTFCRDFKNRKDYSYGKESLPTADYADPIYSFMPSIGISNIVKIPNDFSPYWKDNYFIASLNGGSLYRVKFNLEFNKILFVEKIYIGERIIDIRYDKNNNQFLLALESYGRLGKLRVDKE